MIHYTGIPDENPCLDTSPIVVLPVAYDGTSTWGKGADNGPEAILDASANMELFDIETNSEVYLKGIHTAQLLKDFETPDAMVQAVKSETARFLQKGKFVVTLGGEHSVTIGAVYAYAEKYQDLTVLQLDAHTDLRPEYEGSRFNHACVMARVAEHLPFVQVGIRSMDVAEKDSLPAKRVFFAENIHDNTTWIDDVIKQLSPNVYITIDLDVLDPSIMPSTGTPEPGGMLWYQVLDLLKTVNAHSNIVGFDVVELSPNKMNKAPDFLAAKLVYKLLSYRFILKNQE